MARILLVDDEAPVREMMALACRMDGHEIGEAADTRSAVTTFTSFNPDLMLLDLAMPGGGGNVVIQQLSAAPGIIMKPVIIISGHLSQLSPEIRASQWVKRIIEKPFRIDSLRAAIREVLAASGKA